MAIKSLTVYQGAATVLVPRKRSSFLQKKTYQSLLFLHIPKCGGSFVQDTFALYSMRCPLLTWPEAAGHLTYRQYEPVFKARGEDIQNYLIMTVVRNPWSWHVSWFNYVRQDKGGKRSGMKIEHELFRTMNFSDYLTWLDDGSAAESPQRYIRKQLSDWILDESGATKVDIVLRQEWLYADMIRLVTKLELAVIPVQKSVNVSTSSDYRSSYTTKGIEQIARRHHRDIEMFGYTFDSAAENRTTDVIVNTLSSSR